MIDQLGVSPCKPDGTYTIYKSAADALANVLPTPWFKRMEKDGFEPFSPLSTRRCQFVTVRVQNI